MGPHSCNHCSEGRGRWIPGVKGKPAHACFSSRAMRPSQKGTVVDDALKVTYENVLWPLHACLPTYIHIHKSMHACTHVYMHTNMDNEF